MTSRLASLTALALVTNAGADTVVLSPNKDNTLYSDLSGNLSNGAGQYLFAGTNGLTQSQRALLSFALADSILANATITSVSLTLNMSRTSSTTQAVALHRVLADWGEGTSIAAGGGEGNGAAPAAGDATWIHTFFDTGTWNTPGGDFSAETSATLAVNAAGIYTWESTSQLVADVQAWLEDPTSNFGWIPIGNEADDRTSKRFDSRQNDNSAVRPSLTVEFTMAATTALIGDFDGDDNVGFQDFFLFADHFGTSKESDNWDARFDLAPDDNVGFQDFFVFTDNFGTNTN